MKMRATALMVLLVTSALPALADDAPKPDYSREAIFRFARDFVARPHSEVAGVSLDDLGEIDVYKFGMRGRFMYLPFLAPLPGTRLVDVATVPNAFELTQTQIARSMPYMPDSATLSPGARKELKTVLRIIDNP